MKEAQDLRTPQEKAGKRGGMSRIDAAVIALVVFFLFLAGFAGFYINKAVHYQDAFFLNTYINGIDASGKTAEQVKTLINSGVDGYRLEIRGRGGVTEYLTGESIGLYSEFDGSLEAMIEKQNPALWIFHSFKDSPFQIETMIAWDPVLLEQAIGQLKCLNPDQAIPAQNAYLSGYIDGQGYEIIPEQDGTQVDREIAAGGIRGAVKNLATAISLEELDAYIPPQVTKTDEQLVGQLDRRNRYIAVTITHRFGEQSEILDGDTIHKWLAFDEQGDIQLDEGAAAEYVAELARLHNTAYKPKRLKTSYGDTVTITGGSYGWRINQSAETAAICEIIRSGESQEREPIYSQTAAGHGEHDYGDTYVEINLTAQHLYYYVNGSLLMEADFVSGNESRGWSTPGGAYPLTYKQRNATLKGEGYATPVSYWMPFNGGIGMHDAKWRSSFGGAIYKTGGSHGCVNLPPAAAKTIYENISAGVPVLCYHLSGSAGTNTGIADPVLPTPPLPTQPLPAPPQPSETEPVETAPQETTRPSPPTLPPDPSGPHMSSAPPQETTPAATQLGGSGSPEILPPGQETSGPEPVPAETTAPAPAQPDGIGETPAIIPAG